MDFYYQKIIKFSIYNFYFYDFATLYSFIAIYENIKSPTILKLNVFVHQVALPVINIGIAIIIPIIASPVISPDEYSTPCSFVFLLEVVRTFRDMFFNSSIDFLGMVLYFDKSSL